MEQEKDNLATSMSKTGKSEAVETPRHTHYKLDPNDDPRSNGECAKHGPYNGRNIRCPECAELVREIARELYDRFVMGGWEPQDTYPQIERWLAEARGVESPSASPSELLQVKQIPADWEEVRRGFGSIDLFSDLRQGEFVTASGLHDGGYIVWRKVASASPQGETK